MHLCSHGIFLFFNSTRFTLSTPLCNCQSHSYTHSLKCSVNRCCQIHTLKHTHTRAYTRAHTQTLNTVVSITLGSLNQEQKSPALNQEFLGSSRIMSYCSLSCSSCKWLRNSCHCDSPWLSLLSAFDLFYNETNKEKWSTTALWCYHKVPSEDFSQVALLWHLIKAGNELCFGSEVQD